MWKEKKIPAYDVLLMKTSFFFFGGNGNKGVS